jgi:hypothetical protein
MVDVGSPEHGLPGCIFSSTEEVKRWSVANLAGEWHFQSSFYEETKRDVLWVRLEVVDETDVELLRLRFS